MYFLLMVTSCFFLFFIVKLSHKDNRDMKRKELNIMTARDISAYFITKLNEINIEITNLKLQKLLYFAFKEYYKKTKNVDEPLFSETFEAWNYGPVIREIYLTYNVFGAKNIDSCISKKTIEMNEENGYVKFVEHYPILDEVEKDSNIKEVLDKVIEEYGRLAPSILVELSHQDQCYKKSFSEYKKNKIDNNLIFEEIDNHA